MSFSVSAFAAERLAFPSDLTQGNVRLVLMSVAQATVFPNEKDTAKKGQPWQNAKKGVPCFTVTFLVELLGHKPYEPKTIQDVRVLVTDKPLRLVNGQQGVYQQWFDYGVFQDFLEFTKPQVTDAKRAFIMRYVRFGAIPNLQPFSLVIDAGFGDDIKTFRFDSIRLQ